MRLTFCRQSSLKHSGAFAIVGVMMMATIPWAFALDLQGPPSIPAYLVVPIQVIDHGESRPRFGAGIIVGRDKQHAYIVTAKHLVRRGSKSVAEIKVLLSTKPLRSLPVRLMDPHHKDVAVLQINHPEWAGDGFCQLNLERLGTPNLEDPVYPVGYPNGIWAIPIAPSRIQAIESDRFIFQSDFLYAGHVGGGIVDDRGRLLGMIVGDQPPRGEALRMDHVLSLLESWKYPVQLRALPPPGPTPLQKALKRNDFLAIARFLDACHFIHASDQEDGWPPLAVAVAGKNFGAMRKIFPNLSPAHHSLDAAMIPGNSIVVKRLLMAGAKVNAKFELPGTAYNNFTPLHVAATNGSTEIVALLLDYGADVNAMSFWYAQQMGIPLHYASLNENPEIARLLVDRGSEVNSFGKYGTPLVVASQMGRTGTVDVLLTHPQARASLDESFHAAVRTGHLPIAALLLSHGTSLHKSRSRSDTPLHRAVQYGYVEVVKLLLQNGANVNFSHRLKTALHVALNASSPFGVRKVEPAERLEILKVLLEYGADPTAKDRKEITPLELAHQVWGNTPIETTIKRYAQTYQRPPRGWLGVNLQNLPPEEGTRLKVNGPFGVMVTEVSPYGPLHGRLQKGDAITQFNGRLIPDRYDLVAWVAMSPPGTSVTLTVYRHSEPATIVIAVAEELK